MNKEKISSQEIIDLVASKASVSKRAAEEFLKVMIATVEEGLMAGEVVKIKNFGTFKLQWNEPRKSVNVQTKEEILIAGYYKVVFVPDTVLKEQVNEPFAHLEPVELDVQPKKNELVEDDEIISDPLRMFNEQAFEIKSLISEIQALSSKSTNSLPQESNLLANLKVEDIIEEITEKDQLPKDNNIEELRFTASDTSVQQEEIQEETKEVIQEETKEVIQEETKEVIQEEKQEEQEELRDNTEHPVGNPNENGSVNKIVQPVNFESELPTSPYLDHITATKKRKIWWWVLGVVFLVTGLGAGSYFLYHNNEYAVNNMVQKISLTDMINSISEWFTPEPKPSITPVTVVIPKDTNEYDSIPQNQPIDSIRILFDNPRVYTDFIATERIKNGSRLTIMSKKYYGSKDFWVYIYEANKERISNPDNITIGTLIRIPKLDPRLIDTSNPRCLEKAKELHDIYVK